MNTRNKGVGRFSTLLNQFAGADRFTMKVLQKTLEAQRRLKGISGDLSDNLFQELATNLIGVMDDNQEEALKRVSDMHHCVRSLKRTLTMLDNVTKDIACVRFPEESDKIRTGRGF